MKYNFDESVERRGTNCVKWDESADPDIIPMWVADMDFRVAPAIQKALEQRVSHGVFGYNIVPESYYEAVISWFHRRHQWEIERSSILYTTAVVPAMSCVIKALTMPGEKVLILSPAYNCFFSSIKNNGCEVLRWIGRTLRRSAQTRRRRYSCSAILIILADASGSVRSCSRCTISASSTA